MSLPRTVDGVMVATAVAPQAHPTLEMATLPPASTASSLSSALSARSTVVGSSDPLTAFLHELDDDDDLIARWTAAAPTYPAPPPPGSMAPVRPPNMTTSMSSSSPTGASSTSSSSEHEPTFLSAAMNLLRSSGGAASSTVSTAQTLKRTSAPQLDTGMVILDPTSSLSSPSSPANGSPAHDGFEMNSMVGTTHPSARLRSFDVPVLSRTPEFIDDDDDDDEEDDTVAQMPYARAKDFVWGEAKPYWVPDDEAPTCFGCRIRFKLLRRKHHCRMCGGVFCRACSKGRIVHKLYNKPQLCCKPCLLRVEATSVAEAAAQRPLVLGVSNAVMRSRHASLQVPIAGAGDDGGDVTHHPIHLEPEGLIRLGAIAASFKPPNMRNDNESVVRASALTGIYRQIEQPVAGGADRVPGSKGAADRFRGTGASKTATTNATGSRAAAAAAASNAAALNGGTNVAASLVSTSVGGLPPISKRASLVPNDPTRECPLSWLDQRLILYILLFLPEESLVVVSLTCRYLHDLAQANPIWFALYCSRWAVPASGRIKILAFFRQCPEWSWRQLYMEKRSKEYDADRAAIQHQISLVAQQAVPRGDTFVRTISKPSAPMSRTPFRPAQLREALSTCGAKIVVLGASGIGKSHFIARFMQSPCPTPSTANSLPKSTSFSVRTIFIADTFIRLSVYEIPGDERILQLAPQFYQDAHAVIALYSLANLESFHMACELLIEAQQLGPERLILALVATFRDLESSQRQVSITDVSSFALQFGVEIFSEVGVNDSDTSASRVFQDVAHHLLVLGGLQT